MASVPEKDLKSDPFVASTFASDAMNILQQPRPPIPRVIPAGAVDAYLSKDEFDF